MAALKALVDYLETYRGREKVVRLCNYLCFVGEGISKRLSNGESEKTCRNLAGQFSNLRVMLRLFDDLSMLAFNLSTRAGLQNKDTVIKVTSFIDNILGQLYYPVEHIAWAKDCGILRGDSGAIWLAGLYIWFVSLVLALVKSIRQIILRRHNVKDTRIMDVDANKGGSSSTNTSSQKQLWIANRKELVTAVGSMSDLACCIHWMPPGFLWAGKLPADAVGLFGVISTFCQIFTCSS